MAGMRGVGRSVLVAGCRRGVWARRRSSRCRVDTDRGVVCQGGVNVKVWGGRNGVTEVVVTLVVEVVEVGVSVEGGGLVAAVAAVVVRLVVKVVMKVAAAGVPVKGGGLAAAVAAAVVKVVMKVAAAG